MQLHQNLEIKKAEMVLIEFLIYLMMIEVETLISITLEGLQNS